MVRSASSSAFSPLEQPRLAIASDGTLAAIHEPARVSVVELPGAAPFAEVGIAREAESSDVAWLGAPPRLVVLARYAAHSTVHLVDPYGPRTIAEIRLEAPMRLCATVGPHALALGALGAAVLTATDAHLTPYQFPARAVPAAAGAAAGQFVVALAGSLEEWDPQSRLPKRRIKLARPGAIRAVGGSDRVVWWATQGEPHRIEVSPLVNRGQPRVHELPEAIAHVSGHPRSDLLACVGAETGRIYVLDLDGRVGMRVVGPEGIDRVEAAALVVGRVTGVLAAQARRPVAFVPLERADRETAQVAVRAADAAAPRGGLGDEGPASVALSGLAGGAAQSGDALAQRISAWRDRSHDAPARPEPARASELPASWRDALATWTRAVLAGDAHREAPPAPRVDDMLARFELPATLRRALVLLYGAHLAGEPGTAPVEVARVLGDRWDEALGRGQLALRGAAVYRDSRVRLAPAIQRALDELPARTGTLVGLPGTTALYGPHALVAPDGALAPIAEACLGSVGCAILAGHPHADPGELLLEARAYGAIAMLRVGPGVVDRVGLAPVVLVASDEAALDGLGLPRLG